MTFAFLDRLERAMADHASQPAFVDARGRVTFAGVRDAVKRATAWLRGRGIGPGDRVACLALNCTDAVILEWATYKSGAVWIGIPSAERNTENVRENLNAWQPKLFFLGSDALPAVEAELLCSQLTSSFRRSPAQALPFATARRSRAPRLPGPSSRWDLLCRTGAPPRDLPQWDGSPVARIRYTSGATGKPKGVVYTRDTLAAILDVIDEEVLGYGEAFRDIPPTTLHAAPIAWASGSLIAPTFCRGGTTVLLPRWDLTEFVDLVYRERCTLSFLVPAWLSSLAAYTERSGAGWAQGLRRIVVAGAPTLASVMRRAVQSLPRKTEILTALGMTEASFPITRFHVRRDDIAAEPRPFVPLGPLTPCYSEKTRIRNRWRRGELLVEGTPLAPRRFDWTAGRLKLFTIEKPLASGDIVERDASDTYHYIGRKGSVRRHGRRWLSFQAVEAVLRECPGVARARVDAIGSGDPWRVRVTVQPTAAGVSAAFVRKYMSRAAPANHLGRLKLVGIGLRPVAHTASGKPIRPGRRERTR